MAKTAAERKAKQRARQSAAGRRKMELMLDTEELAMLARNCASRRPGKAPYDMAEYISLLIRQDDARVKRRIKSISTKSCGKCGDKLPVAACACQGDSRCWVTNGWQSVKIVV